MPLAPSSTLRLAAGLSGHADAIRATQHACAAAGESLGDGATDLALLFVSSHHAGMMESISAIVRRELRADCLVGLTAESVLAGERELERVPGVAVLAARLPGVRLTPFSGATLQPYDDASAEGRARIARAVGAGDDLRAVFLFADPFTVPMLGLLPALCAARSRDPQGAPVGTIVGGFASGATTPGRNALILDDQVHRGGLVGVGLAGPVRVDTIVSQGCRGFGPNLVVTGARHNVILTLGGRPALEAMRQAVEELPERDRPLLQKGVFLGRVINEYKDRFGRDDYLIRAVARVDEGTGAIAVTDFLRVGQTVRFHLRDAATAHEDLGMLLDAQQLHEPPAGALLVTCNGRGTRLFDQPHHDAAAVARAFRHAPGGESIAKVGHEIAADEARPGTLPLAGFFAAGEIGPVGTESFVHGHTACVALLRREIPSYAPSEKLGNIH